MAKVKVKKTKKVKKKASVATSHAGRLYVTSTFNNTIATVTNEKGDAIGWSTAGNAGFKGTRKATPFAATSVVEKAIQAAREVGIQSVEVYIKGPGVGRDAALRAVRNSGLSISMIADITPIPHNGPKPKNRRRN